MSDDQPRYEYDDLFVYAPSALQALDEGKALGTAPEVDLVLLDKDKTMDFFLRPDEFATERKKGVTVGRRAFKKIQKRTHDELLRLVLEHDAGESWDTDFKKAATKVMKRAWKETFEAGVRASGIKGHGQGKSGIELSAEDEKWLRSAMQHEMRFLNGFITAITDQTYKMPLPRRVKMYVDALESFYDSARVIGMPATSIMYWTGPRDKRKCESCTYLMDNGPYHKANLPTTPRSGLTICLTNCRDKLLVRTVGSDKAFEVLRAGKTRDQHIRKLRRIKAEARKPKGRSLREDLFYAREELLFEAPLSP